MKTIFVSICIAFTLLTTNLKSQPLTVDDCIRYALDHQHSLQKARYDEEYQKQVNDEFTSFARPKATLNGGFQYLFIIPKQRSDAGAFDFGESFSFFKIDTPAYMEYLNKPKSEYSVFQFGLPLSLSANVQVSQLLFDPSVFVGLKARESLLSLSRLNTQRTEEDIKVNISKAYYNCIIAERRKTLLDDNIALLERIEYQTGKLFDEGFVEKIDVTRLTVQKNNLMTEKEKIASLIELTYAVLKFQMAMPLNQKIDLKDDLTENEITSNLLFDKEIDYNNRIEMQLLSKSKELQQYDFDRYRLSYLPTLSAFGQIGYATQTKRLKEFFTLPYFPTGVLGLNLSVPLYGGGLRKAKMRQAELSMLKLDEDIASFKEAVNMELSNSRTLLRNNVLALKNQENNIELAQKVYDITQKKYKEGLGTNLEIIQAQTALKEAQSNYYTTLYETMVSKIDLLKALGIYKK